MAKGWAVLAAVVLAIGLAAAEEPAGSEGEALFGGAVRQMEAGSLAAARDLLLRLEALEAPGETRPKADLLLGTLLLRLGEVDGALPRLERAAAAYPLLADYALFWLAAASRKAGQPDRAAESLRRLLDRHPESLLAERAGRALPRDWLEAGEPAKAEEAAGQYLGRSPTGPGRAEVWLALGEVFLRSARAPQAEEVFRRIWIELPASPESQRAKQFLDASVGVRPFSADERYRRAMTLYGQGRHAQAQGELAPFAVTGPREAAARLALGIGAFQLRQYDQAVRWLAPLAAQAEGERSEALFWLGRSLGRAGDSAGFTEKLSALADLTPPARRAEEGLFLLAQSAMDDADPGLALRHLGRLRRTYPKGVWRDQTLWLAGWAHYKLRDAAAAVADWERLLAEEPGSRLKPQAAYWRGRALELLGRRTEAVRAYRSLLREVVDQAYYRMRASRRLERLAQTAPAGRPMGTGAGLGAGREGPHLAKGRALRTIGLLEDAAEEYSQHLRLYPEDRASLAEGCRAFLELERYDKAVWMGGKFLRPLFVQGGGSPPIRDYWQCVYPLAYWEAVRPQAAAQGVDPFLVAALIREESAFAPRAVSRTGARGLMQLMPQTAERTARAARLPFEGPDALERPEVNIRIGTLHLAELLRELEGRPSLALAAYNAGKLPLSRWLQRYGLRDEEEFIEDIPYSETRHYVKRVLGSHERYAAVYGTESAERRAPGAESESGGPRGESGEARPEVREPTPANPEPSTSNPEPQTAAP